MEPAFPSTETNEGHLNPGLSVRDYFAAKALSGLCSNPGGPFQANSRSGGWGLVNCTGLQLAKEAYDLADDMLTARAQNPETSHE